MNPSRVFLPLDAFGGTLFFLFLFGNVTAHAQIPGTNAADAFIYEDRAFVGSLSNAITWNATDQTSTVGTRPTSGGSSTSLYPVAQETGDLPLQITGSGPSLVRWELWGQRQSPADWYLLDVAAVLPFGSATLDIVSLDILNPHRTRMSRAYTVKATVSGLQDPASNQIASSYVGLSANSAGTWYGFYPEATQVNPSPPQVAPAGTPQSFGSFYSSGWFLPNGNYSFDSIEPTAPGTDTWRLDWIMGVELDTYLIQQQLVTILDTASLTHNLPANYSGDPSDLPMVTFGFNKLYPGSKTVLRLLKDGLPQTIIPVQDLSSDPIRSTDLTNHDTSLNNLKLSDYITEEGVYSFEAWTAEPFDPAATGAAASLSGVTTPNGYSWEVIPLGVGGSNPSIDVRFRARIQGSIITN